MAGNSPALQPVLSQLLPKYPSGCLPIGFVTDEGRYGASPDRLVGEDGLLEIKCPEAPKHVLYMTGGFGKEYFSQVQGQLLVTGRQWCDLVSYSVDFPLYCERMERDEAYLASLEKCLAAFHETKIRMLNHVNGYGASLAPQEQENV